MSNPDDLLSRILLCQFERMKDKKRIIKPNKLEWIYSKTPMDLQSYPVQFRWKFSPYKDDFYLLLPANYKKMVENTSLLNNTTLSSSEDLQVVELLFEPVFNRTANFFSQVSLRSINAQFQGDFGGEIHNTITQRIFNSKLPVGCYYKAHFIFGDVSIPFAMIFPIKLIRNLIFLLVSYDVLKMTSETAFLNFINHLDREFKSYRMMYPFDTRAFFESLNQMDFQKIISLLFSSNLITNDMLSALALSIPNGKSRILSSISKNLQREFLQNEEEKENLKERRWIEIALYQIMLNIEFLLETRKFQSENLNQYKSIVRDIDYEYHQRFFDKKPYSSWIQEASDKKLLHKVISSLDSMVVARALIEAPGETMEHIRNNISKRGYSMVLEDIEYLRQTLDKKEELAAQYKMVESYCKHLFFETYPEEDRDLAKWIPCFSNKTDFNYAMNAIGSVDLALAFQQAPYRLQKYLLLNLKGVVKYFLEDYFAGVIRFNINYGKSKIMEAQENALVKIFQLSLFEDIKLKDLQEVKKDA